jgi:membrane protein YdbS with pleckstrin-like domain
VPEQVERHDPEGVDYGWVMQVTFVTTILVGAPIVALAALFVSLPTWSARAGFAIRVGAGVWIVTAVSAFLYARSRQGDDE